MVSFSFAVGIWVHLLYANLLHCNSSYKQKVAVLVRGRPRLQQQLQMQFSQLWHVAAETKRNSMGSTAVFMSRVPGT
jgi:hypothetical protein